MPAHRSIAALALSLAGLIMLSGCGGGQAQDAKEPTGRFPVRLVSAAFPANQKLAKTSDMEIVVENTGTRPLPDVNVTVKCGTGLGGSFDTATSASDVADPRRPQFVVNTIPTATPRRAPPLDAAPLERSSAFVDTYPLGTLGVGRRATFRWNVTAVKAGPYRLCWRVNAGLYGKARAVNAGTGGPVRGEFVGSISNAAPKATVLPNGKVVEQPSNASGANGSAGQ